MKSLEKSMNITALVLFHSLALQEKEVDCFRVQHTVPGILRSFGLAGLWEQHDTLHSSSDGVSQVLHLKRSQR